MNRKVAVHSREVSEMCGVIRTGQELENTIANFLHTYLISPALGRALGIPQCLSGADNVNRIRHYEIKNKNKEKSRNFG